MSASDTLLSQLQAERDHYQALLELVGREQEALRRAEAGEVEAIAHEKQAFLPRLAEFARARAQKLRAAGYPASAMGMESWLTQTAHQSCLAAWRHVVALVEEVRRRNQINGQLIEMQARYFALALATMRSADGAGTLCYGADGRAQASRQSRSVVAI